MTHDIIERLLNLGLWLGKCADQSTVYWAADEIKLLRMENKELRAQCISDTGEMQMSETCEDYISIESGCDDIAPEMISNFPIHCRWSDHNTAAQYLEVQTVDGWQAVYPLMEKNNE